MEINTKYFILITFLLIFPYCSTRSDRIRRNVKLNLNGLFIFPGTKWCGTGNIANNDDDLGALKGTDKCCETHDKCPDVMAGRETKHNLINPIDYSSLHCDCDLQFYKCLKLEKHISSDIMGRIYFNILNSKCFKLEYPIIGCNKYTYFPLKCSNYTLDITKPKKYQWFDVPKWDA